MQQKKSINGMGLSLSSLGGSLEYIRGTMSTIQSANNIMSCVHL